mgnify:CR=1 FL=1
MSIFVYTCYYVLHKSIHSPGFDKKLNTFNETFYDNSFIIILLLYILSIIL